MLAGAAPMAAEKKNPTSDLPTMVLAHILSFLPLKLAVQCGAVSKPWLAASRELISHATDLDLGEEFTAGMPPEQYAAALDSLLAALETPKLDSIKIYLFQRWFYMSEKLRIQRSSNYIETLVLVKLAVSRHVKELDVKVYLRCEISGSAFQSTSLTRLSLSHCSIGPPFEAWKLPSLQELSLCNAVITDDFFVSFLTGCPDLTTIKLVDCENFDLRVVKISPPSRLRNLMITCSGTFERVEIEAPTLESLHFEVYFKEIVLKDVSGLKKVHIELPCINQNYKVPTLTMRWALLSALRSVSELTFPAPLFPTSQQIVEIEGFHKLTFVNLKSFRYQVDWLGGVFVGPLNVLHFCNFPVLEQLVIEYLWEAPQHLHVEASPLTSVYQLGNLKDVSTRGFYACDDHMRLVKFLLQRANSLQSLSLNINTYKFQASKLPMLQVSIDALPKANPDAKILLQLKTNPRLFP